MDIQQNDIQVFAPGFNHPFPDPSKTVTDIVRYKPYRTKPILKSYSSGGDIQMIIKKPNPRPVMPKLIRKWKLEKEMRTNPYKYSRII